MLKACLFTASHSLPLLLPLFSVSVMFSGSLEAHKASACGPAVRPTLWCPDYSWLVRKLSVNFDEVKELDHVGCVPYGAYRKAHRI